MRFFKRFAFFCILAASISLAAASTATRYKVTTDWHAGTIRIDVEQDEGGSAGSNPKMRFDAEKRIEGMMSGIFLDSVASVNVDSLVTVGEAVAQQKVRLDIFRQLSESGDKVDGYISGDYMTIRASYEYPVYGEGGLSSCFIRHTNPARIEAALGYTDSARFTGLVIYAKGSYPLYAKKSEGRLERALFPAIYDDDMNLIAEKEMCEPETLKKWGMVLYTDSTDEKTFSPRIGVAPLRTIAVAFFGKRNVDILIPAEDAVKLLSSQDSRKILSGGRILVITD